MDSSILQLFSPADIFERVGLGQLTGLLHIYNLRDTANIFFKNGLIVAAGKGLTEGEDAVRQALDIKEPRFAWHPNIAAPMPPYKPIQMAITELFDHHAARKAPVEFKNAALPVAPPPMPAEVPQPAPPPFLNPARGSAGMTTALPRLEAPMTVQASKPQWPAHATNATQPTPTIAASGKTASVATLQPESTSPAQGAVLLRGD